MLDIRTPLFADFLKAQVKSFPNDTYDVIYMAHLNRDFDTLLLFYLAGAPSEYFASEDIFSTEVRHLLEMMQTNHGRIAILEKKPGRLKLIWCNATGAQSKSALKASPPHLRKGNNPMRHSDPIETESLPLLLGYQVIDTITGEVMIYSEVDILSQEVATRTLFDLRQSAHSPDLYAMIAIFPGDIQDRYGNTPEHDSFVPAGFIFTGSTGTRLDRHDQDSPMISIRKAGHPDNPALSCKVSPVDLRDIIAITGLPMMPQNEAKQRSWPVAEALCAVQDAITAKDDTTLHPYSKMTELHNLLIHLNAQKFDFLILDQTDE